MRRTINEAIHLQRLFRQTNLTIHLTKDRDGLQLTGASLEAQLALAKTLLEVEKIQRAEATELSDPTHVPTELRFAPASIVAPTQYRLEA